jgi:hypothetical protein
MNPKTPRTLVQFAAILVVLGIAVMDPLAGFALMLLAGILSIITLIFGAAKLRVIAIFLLAIVIAFAIWKLPEARKHLQRYRERAPSVEKVVTSVSLTMKDAHNHIKHHSACAK